MYDLDPQLKCQEPLIRGAAQSFLLGTVLTWTPDHFADLPFPGNLVEATDFLSGFHGAHKILIRGTPLWSKCCQWLRALLGSGELVP
jgi:hypothetical protein